MRNLSQAIRNAIAGQEIWPVRLIDIQIGGTTYRISDHYRPLNIGVDTYLANGNLISIDNVVNTTAVNDDSIEVSLSAIDSTFRQDILDADAIGGEVSI